MEDVVPIPSYWEVLRMSTESTRSRRKEKRIPSKLCVRCGGVKPLN